MKTIITALALAALFFSTTGFAKRTKDVKKPSVELKQSNAELKAKLELMMTELETTKNSLAIEKLILTNIVTAYSKSNIKNPELKERLAKAVIRIKPTLTKKEKSFIDHRIAKIQ